MCSRVSPEGPSVACESSLGRDAYLRSERERDDGQAGTSGSRSRGETSGSTATLASPAALRTRDSRLLWSEDESGCRPRSSRKSRPSSRVRSSFQLGDQIGCPPESPMAPQLFARRPGVTSFPAGVTGRIPHCVWYAIGVPLGDHAAGSRPAGSVARQGSPRRVQPAGARWSSPCSLLPRGRDQYAVDDVDHAVRRRHICLCDLRRVHEDVHARHPDAHALPAQRLRC